MNRVQTENLGKFFVDVAKLLMGVVVFSSFPDKVLAWLIGLTFTGMFLLVGLWILVRTENE